MTLTNCNNNHDHTVALLRNPSVISDSSVGSKRMKKRKDLDALVPTEKLPQRRGKYGRAITSCQRNGQHHLLIGSDTNTSEDDGRLGQVLRFRGSSKDLCETRRCCGTCAIIAGFILLFTCLLAAAALIWINFSMRIQLHELRGRLDSAEGKVDSLESRLLLTPSKTTTASKSHSKPGDLSTLYRELSRLNVSMVNLESMVGQKLKETKLTTSIAELQILPQKIQSLTELMATLRSDVTVLQNSETDLKSNSLKFSALLSELNELQNISGLGLKERYLRSQSNLASINQTVQALLPLILKEAKHDLSPATPKQNNHNQQNKDKQSELYRELLSTIEGKPNRKGDTVASPGKRVSNSTGRLVTPLKEAAARKPVALLDKASVDAELLTAAGLKKSRQKTPKSGPELHSDSSKSKSGSDGITSKDLGAREALLGELKHASSDDERVKTSEAKKRLLSAELELRSLHEALGTKPEKSPANRKEEDTNGSAVSPKADSVKHKLLQQPMSPAPM